MKLIVRMATEDDAQALLDIYRPYVEETAVSFELIPPTLTEFRRRIRKTLKRYPYLVAAHGRDILGYTYASPFRPREGYARAVETSIYVHSGYRGKGIGVILYDALERILGKQNVTNLYACISYPYPQSVAFHERQGYEMVGRLHSCGYKLGQWRDIVWMEKVIAPHADLPRPFIAVAGLDVDQILEEHNGPGGFLV